MTDYLAEARDFAGAGHPSMATAPALLSIAESLSGLLAEFREVFAVTPSEPVPSPVALDRAEEREDIRGELLRWRAADRLFPPDCAEWQTETERLRDVADRIGGGL